MVYYIFFFFFQAEDGIRDPLVTGVQTCALPICHVVAALERERHRVDHRRRRLEHPRLERKVGDDQHLWKPRAFVVEGRALAGCDRSAPGFAWAPLLNSTAVRATTKARRTPAA